MDNIKKSLESLLTAMREAGIVSIVADYGGYGDSWDGIGSLTSIDSENKNIGKIPAPIQGAAEDFVVELVDTYHAGFEKGEGGRGTVTLDLRRAGEEIVLEHVYLEFARDEENHLVSGEDDEELALLFEQNARAALDKGVRRAAILIEGYGDSGQTERLEDFAGPFEDWAYSFLESKLPGWENNEGGGAEFVIDFQHKKVSAVLWSNRDEEMDPDVHKLGLQDVLGQPRSNEIA